MIVTLSSAGKDCSDYELKNKIKLLVELPPAVKTALAAGNSVWYIPKVSIIDTSNGANLYKKFFATCRQGEGYVSTDKTQIGHIGAFKVFPGQPASESVIVGGPVSLGMQALANIDMPIAMTLRSLDELEATDKLRSYAYVTFLINQ